MPAEQIVPGWAGSVPSRLVQGLHDRGLHVSVVSLTPGLEPGEVRRMHGPGLDIAIAGTRMAGRARDLFRPERAIVRQLVAELDVPVVHAHWSYEFALGALEARPDTIVTTHDWAPAVLTWHTDPYRLVRLGMQIATLRKAQVVTAVSPYLAHRSQRVHRREIEVIPNGVENSLLVDRPTRPPGPLVVAAINNGWGRLKNVQLLMRCWADVRQRIPDARLRLIGDSHAPDGPAASWVKANLPNTDGIIFEGAMDAAEVAAALDASHFLVHPSREETFGAVIIEAMARGRPVIGGRSSGAVPWVVGDAGILIDIGASQEIVEAIVLLATDAERWEHLASAGLARVREHFTMDAVTDRYIQLYNRVAAQRPG